MVPLFVFNDAVRSSLLNLGWGLKGTGNELGRVCKQSVVTYFMVLIAVFVINEVTP